jgi:hypothetical protein
MDTLLQEGDDAIYSSVISGMYIYAHPPKLTSGIEAIIISRTEVFK